LGLKLSATTALYNADYPYLIGLRLGVPLTEQSEVRAALDTATLKNVIQANVLYQMTAEGVRWYAGAGPEYVNQTYLSTFSGEESYGVHATIGVERAGPIGLFTELQPALAFGPAAFWGRFGFGLNVHF
jgi:hypothetical protein